MLKIFKILFLTINALGFYHACAQIESTFPELWDKNRNLRGEKGQVLSWTYKKDTIRPFEYKSCIMLVMGKDTSGKDEYYISEMYTNEKPFNEWNHASIHYGPDSTQLFGFHDVHIEKFDHKPSQKEIFILLNHWKFKLIEDDWITVEYGIDKKLCMKYFEFIPMLNLN